MRNPSLLTIAGIGVLLFAGVVPRLEAQEGERPKAASGEMTASGERELAALLGSLQALPSRAWGERARILEARISQHRAQAAALRRRSAALRAQAVAEDALAAELERELRRQEEVARVMRRSAGTAQDVVRAWIPVPPYRPLPTRTAGGGGAPAAAAASMPAKTARSRTNFEEHLLPVIEQSCIGCHNPVDARGGLNLETCADALRGAASGPVIAPGDPEGSRLYRLVSHQEQPTMPPDQGPIATGQIEVFRKWIEDGAFPDAAAASAGAMAEADSEVPKPPALAPLPEGAVPMPPQLPPLEDLELLRAPVVKCLDVSPRAPLLAVAGLGEVALHHTETRAFLGALPFDFGQVEVLRFTRDGARLLAAGGVPGRRGAAVLYDVVRGEEQARFKVGYDTLLAAAISPGQSLVAFGGPDRRVRVYAVATGKKLYEIEAHNEWILALDFSPDGNFLATADRAGTIRVWQAETGRDVHTLRGHAGAVHALRFRPDARSLASAGADRTLRVWELEDGKQLKSVRAHGGEVLALDWSRDLKMATSGSDKRAKVWSADGKALKTMSPLSDWGYAAAFSRDGKQLYVGTWQGTVQAFDAATGKALPPFGGPVQ